MDEGRRIKDENGFSSSFIPHPSELDQKMSLVNPTPTKLGLVCLARLTFEVDLAEKWYAQIRAMFGKLDGVELCAIEKLIIAAPDADAAIAELRVKNTDALVILSGTFALGGLAQQFAQAFSDVPILLWGLPEPQEQTGKLRLNSLVGMHVNASNLYKLGYRPQTLYAAMDDPRALEQITRFARIAGILRDLKTTRIALIGGHAPGFDNLGVDKLQLRRALGVQVVDVGLQTIVARAQAVARERAQVTASEIRKSFDDTTEVDSTQGELFAALVIALKEFAAENQFDALAIKCWGDIAETYGIAGCGAVSFLHCLGVVTGCEGDVMGTLTTLIAQRLTGQPPFLTDLVAVERENNTAFLWHIGCAPLAQANPKQATHLFSHFAGGKGVTAGFALKSGRVTILRVGDDGRDVRIIATMATAFETEMDVRGTVSRIKFDGDAGTFLDELLTNGWEHHLVMAYGEIVPELEMLARMIKIPLTIR
jgi:L-fucose isomerase-like protein